MAKGQQGVKIANLSADKSYTFTVKTIDTTGNKSAGTTTEPKQPQSGGSPMTLTLTSTPALPAWIKDTVTVTVLSSTSIKTAKWTQGAKTVKEMLETGTPISDDSFEVTENGTYFVAVQDNDGRREVETIKITNIDKTAPKAPINLTAEYKLSAKKIILKWTDPADTGSEVKELKLTYTVNGTNEKTETIAKGTQTFELPNIEPQSPPVPYAFSLKAGDNAGNEGAEAAITVKPSDQAEVTGIGVSRRKVDRYDPDKTVTVTLYGSNLTKAHAIQIKAGGVTPVTLSNSTDSEASAEFTLPDTVKPTEFKVHIKQTASDNFTLVDGVSVKAQVCKSAHVTEIEVTKQDGSQFETDNYGALKVAANTGGFMKIVLTGENLDIDGLKAGVRFNGQNYNGTANGDGTQLIIENIAIPSASGAYPIKVQLNPRYKTDYTILPDETGWHAQYKSKLFRVLGSVVLKELWLSGYDKTLESSDGWLVIKGANLDNLTADDLSNITSSLGGGVTHAKIIDSTTLKADYIIPDLDNDSAVGKTETLTIAGKTVSAPLHTFEISDNGRGSYYLRRYYSIPSDGKVQIPEYVDDIYSDAFKNCTALTSIDLSGTKLTDIRGRAFSGCAMLERAFFADTTGWAVYNDENCKNKHADIQATDLQNPATAAEYVRSKYYWKKN